MLLTDEMMWHSLAILQANIALNCLKETAELATRVITGLADTVPFSARDQRLKLDKVASQNLLARLHSKEARPAVESCSGADEAETTPNHKPITTRMEV